MANKVEKEEKVNLPAFKQKKSNINKNNETARDNIEIMNSISSTFDFQSTYFARISFCPKLHAQKAKMKFLFSGGKESVIYKCVIRN